MPKISIIIPTLNEEDYLPNTLESIKNQNFKDYELIIADSFSEDSTLDIAKKFRAKIIKTPKKGPGAARNAGAKIAEGEILLFLDADTIFTESNCLEELDKKFKKDVNIALFLFEPSNRNLGILLSYKLMKFGAIFGELINRPFTPGFSQIIKRESFNKVKGYDESINVCEDLDLSLKIKEQCGGKFICIKPEVINSARRSEKMGLLKTIKFYALPIFYTTFLRKKPKHKFVHMHNFK